ncbi:hypothetical protein [Actinokineospora cianjurensis]|uniref:Uncharacterized protein n=1 Tax=Actinokineospora cianjurensis TaxID=585224 RepID=A0A421AYH2_9PSEU|nr:hypothetical protein [Actinokineospora cianjurensis]RLK54841.1 hypothetical protein CLV68_5230 [Actinokineospora cianjurensis]
MNDTLPPELTRLLERISDLFGQPVDQSPDAATWSTGRPEGSDMSGRFGAVIIGGPNGLVTRMALTEDNALDRIRNAVGQTTVAPLDLVSGVGFWRGVDDARVGLNVPAMHTITKLARDVVSGAYAASDRDTAQVRRAFADGANTPTVHGPCVVTGLTADGKPAPFGERLADWVDDYIAELNYMSLGTQIAQQLRSAGIPLSDIRGLTLGVVTD